MRIVSLLPSATELACALGLRDQLVAVSHECDYPTDVKTLPRITSSILGHDLDPKQIDDAVVQAVREGQALYQINGDLLRELEPDLILTQGVCDVCAVSQGTVDETLVFLPELAADVKTLSLSGATFEGILRDMRLLAEATGREARAAELSADLRKCWHTLESNPPQNRPRVLMLEWPEPPFYGGHWVPEMVAVAGGIDVLGHVGVDSKRTTWAEIAATDPDIIVSIACGYDLAKNTEFAQNLYAHPEAKHLRAVQSEQVWACDANSYFSRPAPRIVEGAQVLRGIFAGEALEGGARVLKTLEPVTS